MEYIVVERSSKETWYIKEYYIGNSVHMTENREEAYRFGLSDAMNIARGQGMDIEEVE